MRHFVNRLLERRWTGALGLAVLLVLVEGLVAGVPQVTAQTVAPQAAGAPSRTITVTGSGAANGAPDVAHLSIGVQAQAATVAAALQDANTRMNAVLQALRVAGIADSDMQTNNLSIYFQPQPQPGPAEKPSGAGTSGSTRGPTTAEPLGAYQVSNAVSVTVRDLNKLGAVIDAATAAGSNDLSGISFDVADTSSLESQARAKAMTDAASRAQDLARLAGVTLGQVISISEVTELPGPRPMAAAAATAGGTPVQPGQISFSTQIQVVYAIQ